MNSQHKCIQYVIGTITSCVKTIIEEEKQN